MSVPQWKRDLSKADYMYQTYQLNIRIGEIVANGPKKYARSYGNHLIETALKALEEAQIANSIFVSKATKPDDYEIRRKALKMQLAYIHHIGTVFYIYKEQIKKCDGQDPVKLKNENEEIGERCAFTASLIKGIQDSDRKKIKA